MYFRTVKELFFAALILLHFGNHKKFLSILDSAVTISAFETQTGLKDDSTHNKQKTPTNRSAKTTDLANPGFLFGPPSKVIEDKAMCSTISAGLREAIRSAQLYQNITADNIEFRLNRGTTKHYVEAPSAQQFRQVHRLCQRSFMFASQ